MGSDPTDVCCSAMVTLDAGQAAERLKTLAGWALDGSAVRRKFTFDDFAAAIAFVVRLGFEADAVDHHPDILINYKRVTLTYSTHSAGGLTEKDFAGAEAAAKLAAEFGAS
jgi:4a-hydroxytetrahydrobiopterin dehydratase